MQKRSIRFRGKATGKGNIPTNWVYGGGCFAVNDNTFIIPDAAPKFTGNGVYEAKALKCALYVSPQDCTTYSSQKYSRAMWYAWTEIKSTPMLLSGANHTPPFSPVAFRQKQDLQTYLHTDLLKLWGTYTTTNTY